MPMLLSIYLILPVTLTPFFSYIVMSQSLLIRFLKYERKQLCLKIPLPCNCRPQPILLIPEMSLVIWLAVLVLMWTQTEGQCIPFGLRLSFGEYYSLQGMTGTTQMYVTFNTLGNCTGYASWGNLYSYSQYDCTSQFLPFDWNQAPYFNTTVYTCPIKGINFTTISLYTVTTVDQAGTQLIYRNRNISVDIDDWDSPEQANFVALGDWSYEPLNTTNLPYTSYSPVTNCLNIIDTFFSNKVDAIIFLGNMAYNLSSNNGTNYVEFLQMIEPYSSAWPFMATPGEYDISDTQDQFLFNSSFNYPYSDNNYYYNFTYGQFTFVSFNVQPVISGSPDSSSVLTQVASQLNNSLWNSPTPYVIPFSHYPFFCSCPSVSLCQTNNQTLYPLQSLMVNSGKVPVYLSGHIPSYQRSYPIQLNGRQASINNNLYTQPEPPVYVIEGGAGNSQYVTASNYSLQYFTASSTVDTGFGVLTMTSLGDIVYNHFQAGNCTSSDGFEIVTTIYPSTGKRFSPWLIVLLSLMGISLVGGLIWFVCLKNKRAVRNMSADELQSYYQSMELN